MGFLRRHLVPLLHEPWSTSQSTSQSRFRRRIVASGASTPALASSARLISLDGIRTCCCCCWCSVMGSLSFGNPCKRYHVWTNTAPNPRPHERAYNEHRALRSTKIQPDQQKAVGIIMHHDGVILDVKWSGLGDAATGSRWSSTKVGTKGRSRRLASASSPDACALWLWSLECDWPAGRESWGPRYYQRLKRSIEHSRCRCPRALAEWGSGSFLLMYATNRESFIRTQRLLSMSGAHLPALSLSLSRSLAELSWPVLQAGSRWTVVIDRARVPPIDEVLICHEVLPPTHTLTLTRS